ncbi:MAG TPA: hypothetical protein VE136_12330 [Anaerolineales bacterium]|nr:hypothetical protein [Anaerolineales bacterium]
MATAGPRDAQSVRSAVADLSRFSLRDLAPQLFVIVILPLTLLVLLIALGGLQLHRQTMRNLVEERDERADLIGARLEISSTPSEGTRVELELPLKINQRD